MAPSYCDSITVDTLIYLSYCKSKYILLDKKKHVNWWITPSCEVYGVITSCRACNPSFISPKETIAGSYLLAGRCYSVVLENSHPCVEGAMHHDCPVFFEYLFETRNDVVVMPCGHTIHKNCLKVMQEQYQYSCLLCSKSVCDMSKVWERYDMKIGANTNARTLPRQNGNSSSGCIYRE